MRTKLTSRIEQAMARLEGGDPDRDKSVLLIVDDEKGPRESLRMILSPQHRVLIAEDGARALAILAEQHVDAVTVDLNMPGMKGDVLMRRIRKEFPHVEVVIITGYSSVETAIDGLRHGIFDYLTKPFDVVQVSNTVRRALARRESRHRLVTFLRGIGEVLGQDRESDNALGELAESHALQERLRAALANPSLSSPRSEEDAEAAGRRVTGDFLESLAAVIESRERHRAGHAQRVAFLAGMLAERLGLSADRREEVRVAAFLHDLGRVSLPPRGEGEPVDADAAARHATSGAELVGPLGFSENVAQAIRHHHERWDGSGSPDGLTRDGIPLASRIIAVADAFDRLTHDEPGREAVSPAAAIAALRARSGHDLDPELLKELIVLAESGASSSGPLLGLHFEAGDDPVDTIASATAWLEADR
jgi:putative nucleotidyltransferase with HDIG domain